jgi:hypothetical protein
VPIDQIEIDLIPPDSCDELTGIGPPQTGRGRQLQVQSPSTAEIRCQAVPAQSPARARGSADPSG